MRTICILTATSVALFTCNSATGGTVGCGGDNAREWVLDSVVLAEIMADAKGGLGDAVFRPIGTISGRCDASKFPEVTATLNYDFRVRRMAVKGNMVLVILWDRGAYRHDNSGYFVDNEWYSYMPAPHGPMAVVDGFSDPDVGATLAAIQKARRGVTKYEEDEAERDLARFSPPRETDKYWSTHGVVFAEVKGVSAAKNGEKQATIVLRPKLTFAGAFDAGKTPEVSAAVDFQKFGPAKMPAAGDTVLAVLQREGNSYRVAPERPAYMPEEAGQHAPIRVVKGFSDPKVNELVSALKALRKAERDNKEKAR
jgi:hypothetical protein